MNGPTHGRIVAVNGPLVTCEVDEEREVLQNEVAYVMCDGVPLKSEVIRIRGSHIDLQVFESTTGLKVGDDAEFSGELLTATLGPGMLGMIYDGLQNPLRELENDQVEKKEADDSKCFNPKDEEETFLIDRIRFVAKSVLIADREIYGDRDQRGQKVGDEVRVAYRRLHLHLSRPAK
ncbi:MAG: hypothetical protein GYA83_08200, partial [Deltaproteobacteria bacterium]|nr:hypothetical protein [Deltaproteobacteria bacterium]